jgi:hypothetical protein
VDLQFEVQEEEHEVKVDQTFEPLKDFVKILGSGLKEGTQALRRAAIAMSHSSQAHTHPRLFKRANTWEPC